MVQGLDKTLLPTWLERLQRAPQPFVTLGKGDLSDVLVSMRSVHLQSLQNLIHEFLQIAIG